MGVPVLLYGKSGAGKSRSLKNFAENEILYFNVSNKLLPFKNKFKYVVKSNKTSNIIKCMCEMAKAHPEVKVYVIDDFGFTMADYFLEEHSKGRTGRQVYDLYNEIGDDVNNIVKTVKALPEDIIVYIIMHEDIADDGTYKLRTVGKLVDNYINLEGRVTICIRCVSNSGEHKFIINNDNGITKAPEDMFENTEIENDLKIVDTTIREYYELTEKETENNGN